jgi:effector-binding domain-containing protein
MTPPIFLNTLKNKHRLPLWRSDHREKYLPAFYLGIPSLICVSNAAHWSFIFKFGRPFITQMKKTVLIIFAAVVVITAAIYLLIPSNLTINNQLTIEASDGVVAKFLTHQQRWDKWWPGTKINENQFAYDGVQLTINKTTNGGVNVDLQQGSFKINADINYLAGDFSAKVTLVGKKQSSMNPAQRVTEYFAARDLQNKTGQVLARFKTFLEDQKNAYGYKIYINKVTDPFLLTKTASTATYPDMQSIYSSIENLKKEAIAKGAKMTNFPMLNITQVGSKEYQVSYAIPIDKKITPGKGSIINNLVMGGNLLIADVKGGPNTVNDAFEEVRMYMKDHKLVAPAMPFESMVTDRYLEKDTAKWVTKIYYPIF